MAPNQSRQLLLLSIPTIAVLLSYLWYKRKRTGVGSDPGEISEQPLVEERSIKEESSPIKIPVKKDNSPEKKFSRSLSAPIDIVLPKEHRSRTAPIISDEDLDVEIKRMKSMKSTLEPYKIQSISAMDTPKKSSNKEKPISDLQKTANQTNPPQTKKQNSIKKTKSDSNKAKPAKSSEKKTKISQKEIAVVEAQLTNLQLTAEKPDSPIKTKSKVKNSDSHSSSEPEEQQGQTSPNERDSANHSPVDVIMASPTLSNFSDNHSEGSNDSGKGGSEVATPPSRTPASDGSIGGDLAPLVTLYEFYISQTLVGKLIGANGRVVNDIYNKTHANVIVKRHPTNTRLKICTVEGNQEEIDSALKLIRDKFPLKRYPELTLEQVCILPTVSLSTHNLYLKLVEGINNDTIVSCMVAPNHLFLQQPTHPSFPSLNVLSGYMKICYSSPDSPLLPASIPDNTICVAQSVGEWYRAMILSSEAENNTVYVTFLDYGGYAYVEHSNLRQIRGDFLLLPFQAAECFLANVRPAGEEGAAWSEEAYSTVAELTKGALIYTQISEYTPEGIPLVLMYAIVGPRKIVFLNEELVNQGFAEWTNLADDSEGAVGGVTV